MRYVCMIEYFNNGKVGEPKQNQEINLIAYCMYNRIYHDSPTKGTNGHQVIEEEN